MNEIAQAFEVGVAYGIVLFFMCAHFGYLEKLLVAMEKWLG